MGGKGDPLTDSKQAKFRGLVFFQFPVEYFFQVIFFVISDKALSSVFDELFKSPLCTQIIGLYRKVLAYPAAVAPLRDLVSK